MPPILLGTTPIGKCSVAALLQSMPTFSGRAIGRASGKGALPTFDRQQTSMGCSTVATLGSVTTFAARAKGFCSTTVTFIATILADPQFQSGANVFTGNQHVLTQPSTKMMTLVDTYIAAIAWSGMGSGHAVEIRNARGQLIRRLVASEANDASFSSVKIEMTAVGGYQVQVLESGTLQLMLGKTPRNA